jgi:L-2-hydroxyglutarate oxidase LhgO
MKRYLESKLSCKVDRKTTTHGPAQEYFYSSDSWIVTIRCGTLWKVFNKIDNDYKRNIFEEINKNHVDDINRGW